MGQNSVIETFEVSRNKLSTPASILCEVPASDRARDRVSKTNKTLCNWRPRSCLCSQARSGLTKCYSLTAHSPHPESEYWPAVRGPWVGAQTPVSSPALTLLTCSLRLFSSQSSPSLPGGDTTRVQNSPDPAAHRSPDMGPDLSAGCGEGRKDVGYQHL